MIAGFLQVDSGRFHKLAQAKFDGGEETEPETLTEEQFRQQEYALLSRSTGPASSKLVNDWLGAELYGHLRPYIRGVGLVRKLRETRVLCAFSRLEPRFEADDPQDQPLALGNPRWLPGLDVYGEGIFIEFPP